MVQSSQPIGQENPLLIDIQSCAGLRCFSCKSRYPLFAVESALPTDGMEPGANKKIKHPVRDQTVRTGCLIHFHFTQWGLYCLSRIQVQG